MQAIVANARTQVKYDHSQHLTDGQFSAWCRQQWDAIEPIDDGTPCPDDLLVPHHEEHVQPDPSPVQEAELAGYISGLNGGLLTVGFAFNDLATAIYDGRGRAFTAGRIAGLHVHAREVGYATGRMGDDCVRPGDIALRFAESFESAWRAGMLDWSHEAGTASLDSCDDFGRWQQREDAERDVESRFHDCEIAEAGGWYRTIHV